MSIDFVGGKTYSKGGITDYMMRSFRAGICLRPSCYECSFKGESRVSDLTIFDCWHYEQLTGKKDDDMGHTAVLVHSEKGKRMLESCKDILLIDSIDLKKSLKKLNELDVSNLFTGHGPYVESNGNQYLALSYKNSSLLF